MDLLAAPPAAPDGPAVVRRPCARRYLRPAAALVAVLVLVLGHTSPASAASNWVVPLAASSKGQGRGDALPAAPSSVSAACFLLALQITVSWSPVPHASSYTVYYSASSSSGPWSVAQTGVTGTSWTTGVLLVGTYWFQVSTTVGTSWTGAQSTASTSRSILLGLCG